MEEIQQLIKKIIDNEIQEVLKTLKEYHKRQEILLYECYMLYIAKLKILQNKIISALNVYMAQNQYNEKPHLSKSVYDNP